MKDEQHTWRPILAVAFSIQDFEIVVRGMEEWHLEQVCAAICKDHGEVFHGTAEAILLETLRDTAEGEGKYIRETGGLGNYGHIKLRLEPGPEGTGFRFANELPYSLLPEEYATAAEAGVREAARGGVLFGHEVVDIEATLFDGSYHQTDSNVMAFQIAGAMAFKEAAKKASPVLLEPMMTVEFMVDLANLPDSVSELNARRGRVESVEPHAASLQITALVPLSEMLTSSKHGRPDYEMRFARYEPTRHPSEDSGENSPGVPVTLPKPFSSGSRSAAVQPLIDFD